MLDKEINNQVRCKVRKHDFTLNQVKYYTARRFDNYPAIFREDGVAIENQKKILRRFLTENGYDVNEIDIKTTHQLVRFLEKYLIKHHIS